MARNKDGWSRAYYGSNDRERKAIQGQYGSNITRPLPSTLMMPPEPKKKKAKVWSK